MKACYASVSYFGGVAWGMAGFAGFYGALDPVKGSLGKRMLRFEASLSDWYAMSGVRHLFSIGVVFFELR